MTARKGNSHKNGKPITSRKYADQVVETLERFRASKGTVKAARAAAKSASAVRRNSR